MKGATLKRLRTVGFQLYGTLGKGKTTDHEKVSGYGGRRRGREEQVEHRAFLGSETAPCDIVMVDTQHYAFNKTHRTTQHRK